MDEQIQALKNRADSARILYKQNIINRKAAEILIMPYINAFNEKSTSVAKRYHMRPKLINFSSYIR
jgi:meiotically up-regulated gene 157 (Mug157) protein